MFKHKALNVFLITAFLAIGISQSLAQQPVFKETKIIENTENIIAVDNVCAWPNLTKMPDGTITALIFNKPSHGLEEGNAVCYASKDGGRTWNYMGIPVPNEPGTNRMNLVAGLSNDGSLVTLVSGWGGKGFREYILPTVVSRSQDNGRTWTRKGSVKLPEGEPILVPFGDIIRLGGKKLAASAYGYVKGRKSNSAYLLFSYDDGYTWGDAVPMGRFGDKPGEYNDYNEVATLRIRPDRWLAAARTNRSSDLELIVSEDEGKTWQVPNTLKNGTISRRYEHPAHLLKLNDGRILLTYGIRWGTQGIGARVSDDEGKTWSAPMVVISHGGSDSGYPASVQLEDGTLVTAYYSNTNKNHPRYHMGCVRWKLPKY
ncbi:MAG: exo-alpha-sialidase [Bacteroidales bacterium]|nr:exo-alpha-sialidase [Bacteroidales bacterium]